MVKKRKGQKKPPPAKVPTQLAEPETAPPDQPQKDIDEEPYDLGELSTVKDN